MFPGRRNVFLVDICSRVGETHIPSDMCFPGRVTHISGDIINDIINGHGSLDKQLSLLQTRCSILTIQILTGNTDQNTVVRNELYVFQAMYLRFRPQTWNSHITMRVEVYGCSLRK